MAGAEVVVVDPPRKGLDARVLQALTDPGAGGCSAARLLYLSCG
jgi:tRNA/tmRNA/rRNA uracil-C5-methylase (TrmA/RlmC/RlmD family)